MATEITKITEAGTELSPFLTLRVLRDLRGPKSPFLTFVFFVIFVANISVASVAYGTTMARPTISPRPSA